MRRRGLPEDRPARAGDAVGGRALRRRDRARARRADRPVADRLRRPARSTRQIQKAETMGVFQIESRAQMQMLHRTLPESLDDLTVQVALVRPGPIQGGAVHPYIERQKRAARGPVLRGAVRAPVARAGAAGHARRDRLPGPGDRGGDGVRRLLARRGRGAAAGDEPQAPSEAAMRAFANKFVEGAMARGASREVAERVYEQIVGFSGFGFPKAHSAAFGLLAYQSTWLRVHYGPEFLCALLNEQPMGFYPPDALVHEAQRRGHRGAAAGCGAVAGRVLGGDGQRQTVRSPCGIGLGYVNGVAEADVQAIVAERERRGRSPRRPIWPRAARRGRRRSSARVGGRVRRAVPGRPAPGALAARRGGARRVGAGGHCSWRCRSSRTTRPRCASCRRGSGCSPTTGRPRSRCASTRSS